MYSKKVMEYFKHPKNMGELKNPDAVSNVGSPICGDTLQVYIKVGKNRQGKEIIKNIKVTTFGCIAAVASSCMLGDIVKGMELSKAKKVTKKQVAEGLGGLPPIKMHCSVLAVDGLKEAIKEYEKGKK